MDIHKWITNTTNGDPIKEVARRIERPFTTVRRQLVDVEPAPETVVAIARAYDASPIDGLVTLGLIDVDEASRPAVEAVLRSAKDDQLVAEIYRRLQEAATDESGTDATIHFFPEKAPHAADTSGIIEEPEHP